MDAPAETMGYMIAGYTVIFGAMIIYLVSLIVRYRNLKQEESMLKELEQEKE